MITAIRTIAWIAILTAIAQHQWGDTAAGYTLTASIALFLTWPALRPLIRRTTGTIGRAINRTLATILRALTAPIRLPLRAIARWLRTRWYRIFPNRRPAPPAQTRIRRPHTQPHYAATPVLTQINHHHHYYGQTGPDPRLMYPSPIPGQLAIPQFTEQQLRHNAIYDSFTDAS